MTSIDLSWGRSVASHTYIVTDWLDDVRQESYVPLRYVHSVCWAFRVRVRVLVCGSIVVAAMDRKRGRHEAAFNFNGGAKKSRPGLSLLFTLFQLAISLLFSYMLSAITVPICFYFSMLLSPRQLLLLSSQSIDQEKR